MAELCSAVFLDRDGTLIVDFNYFTNPALIEIYAGVLEGLRMLRAAGYRLVVVTNQSGIGRGFFKAEDVRRFHQGLQERLSAGGAPVDAYYFCPHLPTDGCRCRKPGTELFERAAKEHALDLPRSVMIGNARMDMEAAHALGMRGLYVRTPGFHMDPGESIEGLGAERAPSFLEACREVVKAP